MRRIVILYSGMAVVTTAVLLLMIWAAGWISDLHLSLDGIIALALTVFFVVLLSFGLMVVSIYSNRSGHDQKVMDTDGLWDTRNTTIYRSRKRGWWQSR